MRTNQQVIDLWRSLFPSIKQTGDILTVKSRGATLEITRTLSTKNQAFSVKRQYR
jgi:hypothetical protein